MQLAEFTADKGVSPGAQNFIKILERVFDSVYRLVKNDRARLVTKFSQPVYARDFLVRQEAFEAKPVGRQARNRKCSSNSAGAGHR